MGAPNDSCRGARDSVSQPVMNASDDSGRDDSSIAVPPVGDPSLDTSTEAIDFFASSILDAPLDEHIEDCESGSPPKTKIDATHGGDAQYFTQSPPITPGSSVEASTLQPGNAFDRSPIAAGVRRLFVGSSSDELESLKHMSSVYMTPPDTISTRQAGKRSTANDGHVRVRYKSSSFEISADEQEFATSAPPIPLATELVDTKRKFVVSAMKGGHVLEAVYTLPEECEHLGELYASKGAWALNPDGTVQPRSRTLMSGAAVDGETVAAWVHTDGVKLKQSSTLSVSTTTVDGQSIGSQNTTEYLHGADVDKSDSIPDMLSDSIPDTCPDSISDTCTDESIPDTCTESLEEYEKAIKGGCLSPGMIPTFVDSVLPHPGNVSAASRMGAIGSDPQISTMTRGGVQASVGVRQPDSEDKGKGRSKESPALTEDRTVDGDEGMPLDTTLTHSTHLNAEEDAHIYVDQHDGNIGLVHNRASEVRGNAHSQNKQPTSKDEIEHGTLHKDIHVTQKSTDQFGSEEGGGEGKDDVLRDTASAADIPLPNVGVSKLAEIASRLLQKNTKSARSTVSRAANSSRTQSDSYDEDRSFPVAISTVDPQASIDVKTARELPITADASLQNTRGVSMETEYVGGRARGVKRSAVVPQSISRSEDTESCYMVYRGCDRTFDTIQKRDQYLQTGTGQRPYECAVLKCRQGFAQATEVNAHYGTEHAQLIKRLKLARQAEAKARAQNITAREHADWERVKQHAQEAQRRARRHGDDRDAASGTAKTVKRGKTPQRARPAKVKQKKSTEKHTSKLPNRVVRNKMAFHRALKAVATSGNNGKRTAVGRPKTKTAAAATATAHKTKTATGAGTTKPSSQADKTSSVTKVSKVGDAHKRQPIRVAYPIHPPSPERHYTCPELNCGKRYARKHYYTQHMKKAHQINA
ncbi:hypothetical protein SARC_04933 [Sphaeroforma arctica JP610]|uniref:C2H2-type domain-containing protein n=1 Tax=Sphaeroforma arctica JP610 TaxID=667725 RepID=A0A0L0G103_9EUKA|nr:hypothetical protein SARC_04933 [Sphaeroforma arctica JP610]KNC82802.1 hypothetical protein SARC_04933 [Sphaeroforma arctica JP610]|eukprot:XP_014156704.1 hypothetical protein SARC_04933 [Sphaeroforma arctica JP610]